MPSTRCRLLVGSGRRSPGCVAEGLEVRRLLAGHVVGTVVNDLTGVSAGLGETPLAGWRAYVDADGDRRRDAGEAFAVTDLNGWYAIAGVATGARTVRAEAPSGWASAGRVVDVPDVGAATAHLSARMVAPVVVDVLVAYTPGARVQAGGDDAVREDIGRHVWDANRVFGNSDANVVLRPVLVQEVSHVEGGDLRAELNELSTAGDGVLDRVYTLRNQSKADLVVLYRARTSAAGEIGLGYVLTGSTARAGIGFSVVTHEDGALPASKKAYVLAHEVAHNMGAGHDPGSDTDNYGPAYARGIRVTIEGAAYKDVMSYGAGEVLPVLSDPDFVYRGVAVGNVVTADNARVVRESAATVAGYVAGVAVPPIALPVEPPGVVTEPPVIPPAPPPGGPPAPPPGVEPPVVDEPPAQGPPTDPVPAPPVVAPPVVPPVVVAPTGIDLAAGAAGGAKRVTAGKGMAVSARVVNRGANAFQGKVRVEFFLSKDKVLDESGDVLVKRVTTKVLTLGRKTRAAVVSASGVVKKSVASGKYFVLARVNGDGRVAEDKDTNNVAGGAAVVTVSGGAAAKKKRVVFSGVRVLGEK